MTALELANYIRFRLKENTVTLPDTDLLPIVNMVMFKIARRITGLDEDHFAVIATANLVANQRRYQNPWDLIKMKYLEVSFDGVNWVTLNESDINTTKESTDETSIIGNHGNTQGSCSFDKFGEGFIIRSGVITSVTGGLKLHYIGYPGKLLNLTDNTRDLAEAVDSTHDGLPEGFHEILAEYVIIKNKSSGDKPIALTESEQYLRKNFDDEIDNIAGQNLDKIMIAQLADTGTDNGFNL